MNFQPNNDHTEGLLLGGHGYLVLRPIYVDTGDTAGQRQDEVGFASDHREGTHTMQGVGVNQLRTRMLQET